MRQSTFRRPGPGLGISVGSRLGLRTFGILVSTSQDLYPVFRLGSSLKCLDDYCVSEQSGGGSES